MNTSTHFIISRMGIVLCLILALLVGCGSDSGDSETVSDVSGVSIAALDPSIAADGVSFTVIRAVVSVSGDRSPQGTMVYFHTTHGTIPAAATANHDGVANARLTSSISEVTARVTATAGTHSQTVEVDFVRALTTPARIELLVSKPRLGSAGTDNVILTALAKDQNNSIIPGLDIHFSADNDGTIRSINNTTSEYGIAEALLSAEGSRLNRTINVRAYARGTEGTNSVQVGGTHINIAGATSAVLNRSLRLTAYLRDSDGKAIPGIRLTPLSSAGNIVSSPSLITDSGGSVDLNINPVVQGHDTISVSAQGVSATRDIMVFSDALEFLTPVQNQHIPLVNLHAPVIVRFSSAEGIPYEGATVHFSATRGELSADRSVTNAVGEATVFIDSRGAGTSTLTASVVNGPTVQIDILFVAVQPHHLDLQTAPAIIATNVGGEVTSRSTIHAILRDPEGNLVINQTIEFNLFDVSGGRLTHSFAITDQYGRASTDYISGVTPSAYEGVEVRANVRGWPDVQDSVRLTVVGRTLFIKLGTGNIISKTAPGTDPDDDDNNGNGSAIPDILYYLPYSVLVTDVTGGPVANAEVTLSIWPESYSTGFYRWLDPWVPFVTQGPIPNEDTNRNGILDPGEDVNNNGRLDPGYVATIIPRPDYQGLIGRTGPITLRTDESGFAFFDVVYAREYANWVDMELTARARAFGTEASAVARFALPILGEDISDEAVSPPGAVSPFGPGLVAPGMVSGISVRSGSPVLGANGISQTIIRAFVDVIGGSVEGIPVSFVTTLGSITPVAITDQYGIADAVLTSASTEGTAVVTATAGGFSASVTVQFLMIPPGQIANIVITAAPVTILANGFATTTVTATLTDGTGAIVPIGTPVRFSTTHGTFPNGARDYDTITTNEEGVVQVILTAGLTPGRAEITAKSRSTTYPVEAMTIVQMEFPR